MEQLWFRCSSILMAVSVFGLGVAITAAAVAGLLMSEESEQSDLLADAGLRAAETVPNAVSEANPCVGLAEPLPCQHGGDRIGVRFLCARGRVVAGPPLARLCGGVSGSEVEGFLRLTAPFVARTVRRNWRLDLARLKQILETKTPMETEHDQPPSLQSRGRRSGHRRA